MGRDHTPITLNKYLYGHHDPANNIDPTGNMALASVGAAGNIRARLATMSTPAFQNFISRALWGGVKEAVEGQITQAAFGVIGEHVINSMVNAVDGASGKSASSFGSTAHKRLQDALDENSKQLNRYLRKFNARLETEIFMLDNDGGRTRNGGKNREKGSMGLDVVITNTITGKTILAFDLKTGKSGTSKSKLPGYQQRFNSAPIIDVFIRRK